MTHLATIANRSKVQVGVGGDASAEYPMLSLVCSMKRLGADGRTPHRMREQTWTIVAKAGAANAAAVQALRDTLETTVARTGARVRITEYGATRDMPAPPAPGSGAVTGSLPGYPRVSISEVGDKRIGVYVTFTLVATTIIAEPDAASDNLVDHNPRTTTTSDYLAGTTTTTQRGTVIVAPGYSGGAEAWIEDNIFQDLRDAVDISGETLIERITTIDPCTAEYEYTVGPPPAVSPGGGLTSARVLDRTAKDSAGRRTRTISGDALGPSAATFAAGQRPTPGAGEILIDEDVSEPQVSDGRVDFRYTMLSGVLDAHFGAGIYVVSWRENIRVVSQGVRRMRTREYLGAPAQLVLGAAPPFVYEQTADIEYIGTYSEDLIPLAMSGAALVDGNSNVRYGKPRPGLCSESISATFAFETSQTVPEAHEVPGL